MGLDGCDLTKSGGEQNVAHLSVDVGDHDTLAWVRTTHPFGADQSPLRFARLNDPVGIRLTGTADDSNHEVFAAVLASLTHLAGPAFIDATQLQLTLPAAWQLIALPRSRHPEQTILQATPDIAALLQRITTPAPTPLIIHPAS